MRGGATDLTSSPIDAPARRPGLFSPANSAAHPAASFCFLVLSSGGDSVPSPATVSRMTSQGRLHLPVGRVVSFGKLCKGFRKPFEGGVLLGLCRRLGLCHGSQVGLDQG